MEAWEEIGEIMDTENSTVANVKASLDMTEKGRIKSTLDNCMIVMRRDPFLKGAICKNEMTGRVDIVKNLGWNKAGTVLTDMDEYQIQWYFERIYELSSERNINKAIRMIASENKYHPVKQYLEQLHWDGVPRINTLLPKYLGVDDNAYSHEVMHLLMQAMIHRVYVPGCKFEIMVCLVGGQGAGKSTFFRFLSCLDDWFSDDLKRLEDDKVYRKLQGHWLIEMSEMLATANARSIEDIKSFLSRQKDNYKIPYETHPEDRPRQCVFVGTSNNLDFLPLDRSGNRRFAPVRVYPEKVDKHILEDEAESREYIKNAWAEAMAEYMECSRHVLKFSKQSEEYLKELQKEFMPEDTTVGVIEAWLMDYREPFVCSRMIYEKALEHEYDEPKKWEIHEINNIMNESITGWEKAGTHRFAKYGIQRAWKRIEDNEGFQPIPEQYELPFK